MFLKLQASFGFSCSSSASEGWFDPKALHSMLEMEDADFRR
jgi:hypothetical protein